MPASIQKETVQTAALNEFSSTVFSDFYDILWFIISLESQVDALYPSFV